MKKEEFVKYTHWLWKQRFTELVYDIGINKIVDKYFSESSDLQDKTPKVGNNEDKKEDLCKCRTPKKAYLASNFCWNCRKYTY